MSAPLDSPPPLPEGDDSVAKPEDADEIVTIVDFENAPELLDDEDYDEDDDDDV